MPFHNTAFSIIINHKFKSSMILCHHISGFIICDSYIEGNPSAGIQYGPDKSFHILVHNVGIQKIKI